MESLSIPKSGHSGTIPDSIGCLSFLRTIEFFRNRIYGPIPFSIRLFVGNLFQLWAQFLPDNGAGVAVFVVCLVITCSIWSLGIIVLVLVMILVDLLGVMAILDIQLNVVSVVNLVMLVGIAIEFCVHITHAFLWNNNYKASGSNRSLLLKVYYFRMYLALVLLRLLHGLVFLPSKRSDDFLHNQTKIVSFTVGVDPTVRLRREIGPRSPSDSVVQARRLGIPIIRHQVPQSSMILPADHVLRAVINARLPVPLLLLVCFWSYLFHAVMLPYQVGDVPLTFGLASFFARLFKMTNFAVKHSIMTPEMVENFCNDYYIPDEVHPVAPGRDKTITQFPEGKVGVYTRFFDYCGYRIPFTNFFMAVLRYFCIHISQLSPFGVARVSHFEVLTRVLDLAPSVTVFRAFYTRTYSDGLFSFAKRSPLSPSCFPKPPDSIKNWSDHFFWVDAKVFPIPISLYMGGALEKGLAPHLTARQEQTVRLLENSKAPFRHYPECFLCLVGLSPYYPFDENTYPAFERPDRTDYRPSEGPSDGSSKKDDQVKLLESTSHCFMSLVTPAAGGSSSSAALEVSAPARVELENVVPEDTYLDLTGPDEVVATQSGKSKRKRLGKQSDTLPAKPLRKDHPSLATGTGGKTLAGLRQLMPTSPLVLSPSSQADIQAYIVQSAWIADVQVYTAAATVTSARENVGVTPTSDVAGSSQLETSEGSDDSIYELPVLNSAEAKRCMDYEQLYTEFNVGAARQICLESEVRSRAEHELELKEKLKGKYDARGRLLEEKDLEILRLKSLLVEEAEKAKRAETVEVVRLCGQVSALTGEVSTLKSTIAQKDTDISLLDSRATYLKSALDDSKAACAEAGSLITSLTSERDRLTSEVSTLHTAFQDFKEKAEAQQEEQA
ncbi:gypsy type transposase [Tanacetum coccineum]